MIAYCKISVFVAPVMFSSVILYLQPRSATDRYMSFTRHPWQTWKNEIIARHFNWATYSIWQKHKC